MIKVSAARIALYVSLGALIGGWGASGMAYLVEGDVTALALLGLAAIVLIGVMVMIGHDRTRVTGDASPSGADTGGAPGA